jgi:hypothetical protein
MPFAFSLLDANRAGGLLLDGDFSAFLGLEKIPQPDNFKNMYR